MQQEVAAVSGKSLQTLLVFQDRHPKTLRSSSPRQVSCVETTQYLADFETSSCLYETQLQVPNDVLFEDKLYLLGVIEPNPKVT